MKVNLSTELHALEKRNEYSQKEISIDAELPFSTYNGYSTGSQDVPIAKAAKINKAKGDSWFSHEIAHQYFGTIKALDGKVGDILTPTELDYLEEVETSEREERRDQTKKLLIKSKLEPLNDNDRDDLEKYVMEFLDEVIVELSIIFSILKILGMTVTAAFTKRLPHWIEKKYMKGE